MSYCLIQDAWKDTDYFNNNEQNIEKFQNIDDKFQNIDIKKNNGNDCDKIFEHIYNCDKCKEKIFKIIYKNKYDNAINYVNIIIQENRNIIVIILFILFILLLFNLLIHIIKSL